PALSERPRAAPAPGRPAAGAATASASAPCRAKPVSKDSSSTLPVLIHSGSRLSASHYRTHRIGHAQAVQVHTGDAQRRQRGAEQEPEQPHGPAAKTAEVQRIGHFRNALVGIQLAPLAPAQHRTGAPVKAAGVGALARQPGARLAIKPPASAGAPGPPHDRSPPGRPRKERRPSTRTGPPATAAPRLRATRPGTTVRSARSAAQTTGSRRQAGDAHRPRSVADARAAAMPAI